MPPLGELRVVTCCLYCNWRTEAPFPISLDLLAEHPCERIGGEDSDDPRT
jgi:hypothetical protein